MVLVRDRMREPYGHLRGVRVFVDECVSRVFQSYIWTRDVMSRPSCEGIGYDLKKPEQINNTLRHTYASVYTYS